MAGVRQGAFTCVGWKVTRETTISATDDIGHDHIGHKACHVFVRFSKPGRPVRSGVEGSGVADGIPKNLKWTICGIVATSEACHFTPASSNTERDCRPIITPGARS